MPLPITAVVAGLLALWLIYLQWHVVAFRRRRDVSLGDGGHADGARLIRAHANAAESIPIFLILLGVSEGLGAPGWLLWTLGGVFVVGRVLHGLHFVLGRSDLTLRFVGMLFTVVPLGVAAVGAIAHGLAGSA